MMFWCYLITCMARREVLNLAFVAIHHVMKDTRHRLRGFNPCRQTSVKETRLHQPRAVLPLALAYINEANEAFVSLGEARSW